MTSCLGNYSKKAKKNHRDLGKMRGDDESGLGLFVAMNAEGLAAQLGLAERTQGFLDAFFGNLHDSVAREEFDVTE
jgi:hypothetical protein